MAPERKDHLITDANDFPTASAERWDANIAAIRLSKELEAENRDATPQERAVLAQYSGFGDSQFRQALQGYAGAGAWRRRQQELEELVTPEELDGIRRSHSTAFYTTPEVVGSMWDTLSDLGADRLERPKVLEPSAGSGRFLGLQPEGMAAKSERTAVEIDPMTASILKHTYPETRVYNTGFEEAPIPDDEFDIVISNVPFGDTRVYDQDYNATGRKYLTNRIHNYFFAKGLDKARPGGVVAFVTSAGTMNAPASESVRRYLAERGDLMGAVRLPESAFPDTDVVTDIIYLRKREEGDDSPIDDSWVESEPIEVTGRYGYKTEMPVNRYFIDNPDKVLGKHSSEGSMYAADSYTVKGDPDRPLSRVLPEESREIVQENPQIRPSRERDDGLSVTVSMTPSRVTAPPKFVLEDGELHVSRDGSLSDEHGLSKKDASRVTDLLKLRDTARRLVDHERAGTENTTVEATREELAGQYQEYVDTHGEAINTPANRKLLGNDTDDHLLFALEHYDRDSECWQPADIMHRRVIGAVPAQRVGTPADAMQVVMNESGKLDFDRMGEVVGKSAEEVRSELAQDRLIFKSPKGGNWIPATEYLTGNVREKLREAERAASVDPAYREHVEALRDVQPPAVTAEEIHTPLGAPWIPAGVVNEFVKEEFRLPYNYRTRNQYVRYLGETESFVGQNEKGNKSVQGKVGGGGWSLAENFKSEYADITYGTKGMPAKNILLKTLQGSPISVTKPNPDGDGRVHDPEGTIEAQQKSAELQEAFNNWIWKDPERRARLEEKYNDTHNATRPRTFDGSHQTFPGMSAVWQKQMRPHQRDAIYRTVTDGTTLLAHEVGFGKSATMIASAMERKRLGLANKSVFVVPKATHEQFVGQFMEVYPGARLLAPDADDFKTGNRQDFLGRIATGDWDGVVLSYEQFERIPLSPETEMRWIEQQRRELEGLLSEIKTSDDGGSRAQTQRTLKQINKKLENYTVRLKQLRDRMADRSDDTLNFEDLGIDQIYVDEADNYKNLPYVSEMASGRSGIKGLPQSEAQRAWDMYMKVRYLQEKSGQKPDGSFAKGGVVFATGTPVANTIAETYTMMRYLQPDELKRRGLDNFDAWAKTYGHVKSGMEFTAGGKYKTVQRFSRFVNLPELSTLFQNVADIRVASEVPEMLEAQPRLVDDSGEPKRTTVVAPAHDALEDYMAEIIERVDSLGNVAPHEDNMLKISGDARKAAMDVQMVRPDAPYNPEGKIPLAAERIAEIYEEEADRKGTQLVFLDLGTPKETVDKGAADDGKEQDDLTGDEQQLLTNVYGRLRTELARRGVPEEQVAFIHEYKTPAAKDEILDKVRRGDVRVLIGSTVKLGVGINVQDRAAAAHHIDVPWRPRDVEQREGRVIRQGSQVYGPELDDEGNVIGPGRGVQIFQYVQQGSFDRFMWQAVEEKARGIKALMKRHQTHREMEDIDELVIGASEAKALASGNPLAIRAEELRQRVDMARLSHAAHRRRQFEAETQKRALQPRIDAYRKSLTGLDKDAEYVESLPEKQDFTIEVGNQTFDKRTDAGEALVEVFNQTAQRYRNQGYIPIGQYKGFTVALNTDGAYQLTLIHPETKQPHEGRAFEIDEVTPRGLMARLDSLVRGLPERAANVRTSLERAEDNVRLYDEQLGKPFEDAEQLAHMESQLRVIRSRLSGDEKMLQEGDDPEMDVDTDWTPDKSIDTPAKVPAETPREIPDAGPTDLRQAVEIARSEEDADTPEEVMDALQGELESEGSATDDPPAVQVTVVDAGEESETSALADDSLDFSDEMLSPDPDIAASGPAKVPLSELDELSAEFGWEAFTTLDVSQRLVLLQLYMARTGVTDAVPDFGEETDAPALQQASATGPRPEPSVLAETEYQEPIAGMVESDPLAYESEEPEPMTDDMIEASEPESSPDQEDTPTESVVTPIDEPEPSTAAPAMESEPSDVRAYEPEETEIAVDGMVEASEPEPSPDREDTPVDVVVVSLDEPEPFTEPAMESKAPDVPTYEPEESEPMPDEADSADKDDPISQETPAGVDDQVEWTEADYSGPDFLGVRSIKMTAEIDGREYTLLGRQAKSWGVDDWWTWRLEPQGATRAWWTGQGTPDEAIQQANIRIDEELGRERERDAAIERIRAVGTGLEAEQTEPESSSQPADLTSSGLGNLGLVLEELPSGKWGFVGRVPRNLMYVQKDGSPPTDELAEAVARVGPGFLKNKIDSVSFETKEEALAAAARETDEPITQISECQPKPSPKLASDTDARADAPAVESESAVTPELEEPEPVQPSIPVMSPEMIVEEMAEENRLHPSRFDYEVLERDYQEEKQEVVEGMERLEEAAKAIDMSDRDSVNELTDEITAIQRQVWDLPDEERDDDIVERFNEVEARTEGLMEEAREAYFEQPDTPSEVDDSPADAPEPSPDLDAATAEVKAVTDDGIVTAAEARETADEAAQLLSEAAQETPNNPEPRRGYDPDGEIERLVMELCEDPEEMRKVLARARDSRSDAEREAKEHDGTQRVSDEVRSAAARVLSRLSKDERESDRQEGKPPPERQERVSDVELLRRAADQCKSEGREDDVIKEVEEFLRSQRDNSEKSKSLTGKFAALAKQAGERRGAAKRSRSGRRSSAGDGLKNANVRLPSVKVVTR